MSTPAAVAAGVTEQEQALGMLLGQLARGCYAAVKQGEESGAAAAQRLTGLLLLAGKQQVYHCAVSRCHPVLYLPPPPSHFMSAPICRCPDVQCTQLSSCHAYGCSSPHALLCRVAVLLRGLPLHRPPAGPAAAAGARGHTQAPAGGPVCLLRPGRHRRSTAAVQPGGGTPGGGICRLWAQPGGASSAVCRQRQHQQQQQ